MSIQSNLLQIPPLGKNFVTPSNTVDHVWYGFFRRSYDYIKVLTNGLFQVSNVANAAFDSSNQRQYGNITGGPGGWEDLRFPASALNPPGTVGPPTYDLTSVGYSFSATGDERVDVVAQMPHGWKRGSNIRPHIHWRPLANSSGNVVWQIQYAWSNSLGQQPTFSFANVNGVVSTSTGNVILKEHITGWGNITPPAGAKESSIMKAKILRIGTSGDDTYAGGALMDEVDIHYYHEKSGTDPEYPI